MQEHHVRPDGPPPVSGYSRAVAFSGRMIAVCGQVQRDEVRERYTPLDQPPASSVVQVSSLASRAFKIETEAWPRPDRHSFAARPQRQTATIHRTGDTLDDSR